MRGPLYLASKHQWILCLSSLVAYRTLIIDAAPENTTIENICEIFPEAVLVVKFEITEDQYTW